MQYNYLELICPKGCFGLNCAQMAPEGAEHQTLACRDELTLWG